MLRTYKLGEADRIVVLHDASATARCGPSPRACARRRAGSAPGSSRRATSRSALRGPRARHRHARPSRSTTSARSARTSTASRRPSPMLEAVDQVAPGARAATAAVPDAARRAAHARGRSRGSSSCRRSSGRCWPSRASGPSSMHCVTAASDDDARGLRRRSGRRAAAAPVVGACRSARTALALHPSHPGRTGSAAALDEPSSPTTTKSRCLATAHRSSTTSNAASARWPSSTTADAGSTRSRRRRGVVGAAQACWRTSGRVDHWSIAPMRGRPRSHGSCTFSRHAVTKRSPKITWNGLP